LTLLIQDKSLMRYVPSRVMWRPADRLIGINGAVALRAT